MIYTYHCDCGHSFDAFKPVARIDEPEPCEKCQGPTMRQMFYRTHFINEKVEHAEFNPGLGCVVKNRTHRAEIAKRRNLVEIGNEPLESLHKEAEKTLQDRLSWDKVEV